ncbi:MAG: hypothetical protein HYY29_00495 [Chloroflexi bacterium]|nr:hypothetical protein [Chloroflexota bacterium]
MKQKWLVVLLLSIVLVTSAAPPAASARAEDLNATLQIVYIDPQASVRPIPAGVATDGPGVIRWLVRDRKLVGTLAGGINGTIVFVSSGNLDVNQDGRMHGTFSIFNATGYLGGSSTVNLAAGAPSPFDINPLLAQLPYLDPASPYAQWLGWLASLVSQGYTFYSLPINGKGRLVMEYGTGSFAGVNGTATFGGVMANALLGVSPSGESHVVGMLPSAPIPVTGKLS